MKANRNNTNGKTVAKIVIVIIAMAIILFLDYCVIRGAYLGIQSIQEALIEWSHEVSARREAKALEGAETERKITTEDLKEIWKKEQEELERIQSYPPKEIPED